MRPPAGWRAVHRAAARAACGARRRYLVLDMVKDMARPYPIKSRIVKRWRKQIGMFKPYFVWVGGLRRNN